MTREPPEPESEPEARARMLDRLLSGRDAPAVTESEALFARVQASRVGPRPARWAWGFGVGALVATAATLLMFVGVRPPGPDELRARGDGEPVLGLRCVRAGAINPCVSGAELALEPIPPRGRPFVAAFSLRDDGTMVWYAPLEGEHSARASSAPLVFHLGDDHPPGLYRVFAVFSASPLDRKAIASLMGDALTGDPSVTVIERALSILPAER